MGYDVTGIPIAWEDQPGSTVELAPALAEFARALLTVRHRALAIQGQPFHSPLPEASSEPLINMSHRSKRSSVRRGARGAIRYAVTRFGTRRLIDNERLLADSRML